MAPEPKESSMAEVVDKKKRTRSPSKPVTVFVLWQVGEDGIPSIEAVTRHADEAIEFMELDRAHNFVKRTTLAPAR